APGQTRTVNIELDSAGFATWDSATQSPVVDPGLYRILVGTSSRDLPLSAPVLLGERQRDG
ncbi:MAG: fibronectin type III-like domain-contianing protein, partial [Actinobacteria bacterium]|nr:fibronectin type III-like domain-contianing protein [Actinomycetota bacterium]